MPVVAIRPAIVFVILTPLRLPHPDEKSREPTPGRVETQSIF